MKPISTLFLVLGLILLSSASLRAQREVGAESLSLDDGAGHVVDIKLPSGLTGGPYTWLLPITVPGGVPLVLPTGTTPFSTLYWNATTSMWTENTSVLMPSAGVLDAASSATGQGTSLSLAAGSSGGTNSGSNISLAAGNASVSGTGGTIFVNGGTGAGTSRGGNIQMVAGTGAPGGSAFLVGGTGTTSNGGAVELAGGNATSAGQYGGNAFVEGGTGFGTGFGGSVTFVAGPGGATGAGGGIYFKTSPSNATPSTVMGITSNGDVQIGLSNQFQVDNSGDITTTGTLTTGTTGQFQVDDFGNASTSGTIVANGKQLNGPQMQVINLSSQAGTDGSGINIGMTGANSINAGIQFNISGATTNYDITGTSGWNVTSLGAGTFGGITDNGTLVASYAPNLGSPVLSVTNTASATTNVGETIANTGNGTTAIGLVFDNSGSAATNKYDIQGTGTAPGNWNVTSAGAGTFSSLTLAAPLAISQGGTGATTVAGAQANLGINTFTPAYLNAYYTGIGQFVPLNSAVFFSSVPFSVGFTSTPNSFTVITAGVYNVEFTVTPAQASDFAITVNGFVAPNAAFGCATGTTVIHGNAILSLNAGDVLALINNNSPSAVILNPFVTGSVVASITAVRIQ